MMYLILSVFSQRRRYPRIQSPSALLLTMRSTQRLLRWSLLGELEYPHTWSMGWPSALQSRTMRLVASCVHPVTPYGIRESAIGLSVGPRWETGQAPHTHRTPPNLPVSAGRWWVGRYCAK